MIRLPIATIVLLSVVLLVTPVATSAASFADYHMLLPGHSWLAQNYDAPGDTYTMYVSDWFDYHGQQAVEYHISGEQDVYLVCRCDLGTGATTMFALHNGSDTLDYTPDIIIGEFEDGDLFEVHGRSLEVIWMLRYWDSVPAAVQDTFAYAIPDAEGPLAFWVTYDCAVPFRNRQNDNVEAGLGPEFSPPEYAVTDLWWFERGKGNILRWGVSSDTGDLTVKYQMSVVETAVARISWGRLKALYR